MAPKVGEGTTVDPNLITNQGEPLGPVQNPGSTDGGTDIGNLSLDFDFNLNLFDTNLGLGSYSPYQFSVTGATGSSASSIFDNVGSTSFTDSLSPFSLSLGDPLGLGAGLSLTNTFLGPVSPNSAARNCFFKLHADIAQNVENRSAALSSPDAQFVIPEQGESFRDLVVRHYSRSNLMSAESTEVVAQIVAKFNRSAIANPGEGVFMPDINDIMSVLEGVQNQMAQPGAMDNYEPSPWARQHHGFSQPPTDLPTAGRAYEPGWSDSLDAVSLHAYRELFADLDLNDPANEAVAKERLELIQFAIAHKNRLPTTELGRVDTMVLPNVDEMRELVFNGDGQHRLSFEQVSSALTESVARGGVQVQRRPAIIAGIEANSVNVLARLGVPPATERTSIRRSEMMANLEATIADVKTLEWMRTVFGEPGSPTSFFWTPEGFPTRFLTAPHEPAGSSDKVSLPEGGESVADFVDRLRPDLQLKPEERQRFIDRPWLTTVSLHGNNLVDGMQEFRRINHELGLLDAEGNDVPLDIRIPFSVAYTVERQAGEALAAHFGTTYDGQDLESFVADLQRPPRVLSKDDIKTIHMAYAWYRRQADAADTPEGPVLPTDYGEELADMGVFFNYTDQVWDSVDSKDDPFKKYIVPPAAPYTAFTEPGAGANEEGYLDSEVKVADIDRFKPHEIQTGGLTEQQLAEQKEARANVDLAIEQAGDDAQRYANRVADNNERVDDYTESLEGDAGDPNRPNRKDRGPGTGLA